MGLFRSILVADDEASIRHVLTAVLSAQGYEVQAVPDGEAALQALAARHFDVLVSDVRMPKLDGLELLQRALAAAPELTALVMSAYGSKELALEAVRRGAYDFVQKPFKPEELVLVLQKAEERQRLLRENRRLKAPLGASGPLERLVGESEAMRGLRRQVERVAKVPSTVLVTGESGTGKELVARAIHELSPRAALPFVAVNCGAIPEALVESELFGHARGAFTDARTAKRGLLSEADGGTLLLDEVGELPLPAQVKLLRFLQEGEVRPVGETRAEKVDVRIVAATHRDLTRLIDAERFREDLYFRLNVFGLSVPPLRERQDDVPRLAGVFLARFNVAFNREPPIRGFSPEALAQLQAWRWPGNVRELLNVIERATILCEEGDIRPEHLPERLWTASSPAGEASPAVTASSSSLLALPSPEAMAYSLKRAMLSVEEQFIRAALRKTKGNRTRAAELLEISHRALLYKLKDYGIDADAEGERG